MAVSPVRYQASARSTNPETALDTALNSLANNSGATSAAISNTELDTLADAELVLGSLTPTADNIELYSVRQVDGTNYEDVPPNGGYVGSFFPGTSTGAKRLIIPEIPVPVRDHKWHLLNRCGVSFASSGNTLKVYYYRMGVGS